jgi:hypothetical protein
MRAAVICVCVFLCVLTIAGTWAANQAAQQQERQYTLCLQHGGQFKYNPVGGWACEGNKP